MSLADFGTRTGRRDDCHRDRAASAANDPVEVTIDFAKVMKLDHPAHTIFVGNPGIAYASVADEQTLVLTGKTAGTTNLIVLTLRGAEILNTRMPRLLRHPPADDRLLWRGPLATAARPTTRPAHRQTFSCAPVCELVRLVGDDPQIFTNATTQIQARKDFSIGQ